MQVSVVINTYNRGEHLRRLLIALSRQTYDDFEVIVVNGPSTDNTKSILKEFADTIVIENCPVVNLSVSRNIGIQAAKGDIIAFIDDDAVPGDEFWIERIVDGYTDESVGGVGGAVYRLYDKQAIEFEKGCVDCWGMPHTKDLPDEDKLNKEYFYYIQGTNCSFRRCVLEELGGFDEFYEYFHDESDLCVRIAKAGYRIHQLDNAPIFHEAAGSHIRKDTFHLQWDVITKNQVYFGIKNSDSMELSMDERISNTLESAKRRLDDFDWMLRSGHITEKDYDEFCRMWREGVKIGKQAGVNQKRKLMKRKGTGVNNREFKRYKKTFFRNIMHIVLLCEEFDLVKPTNGVAAYTARLAKDYRALGHDVHVIVPGTYPCFRLIEGVNVHGVPLDEGFSNINQTGLVARLLQMSYTCSNKIEQLCGVFGIDVIESPLWNSLGLISSYKFDIPFFVRLETPLKVVEKIHGWKHNGDLETAAKLETKMMMHADGIICISDAIRRTIEKEYNFNFTMPVKKNYLGIVPCVSERKENRKTGITVFFLGRLERRKGIHRLLESVPEIVNKYPDVRFRIAGNDSIVDDILGKTFKEDFLSKNSTDIQDKVVFLGEVDEEQKEQELVACDIFVAPSLYESFGIIFLEAMRHGKPVIGCKIGGMEEVVRHGETGFLATPDNTEDLIYWLDNLLSNPVMREEMGSKARNWVRERFDNRQQAKEAIDFYTEIINQRNNEMASQKADSVDEMVEEILYADTGFFVANGDIDLTKEIHHLAMGIKDKSLQPHKIQKIDRTKILRNVLSRYQEIKHELREELNTIKENPSIIWDRAVFTDSVIDGRFMFPWKSIRPGARVVLYGGGVVGKTFLHQIMHIPFCTILAVCDRNPDATGIREVPVILLKELSGWDNSCYDVVLIANEKEDIAWEIRRSLELAGIPLNKIKWINPKRDM